MKRKDFHKHKEGPKKRVMILVLLGIIVCIIGFLLFHFVYNNDKDSKTATSSSSVKKAEDSQTVESQSTEQTQTPAEEYPFEVKLDSIIENGTAIFRPVGNSVGSLNRGKSVTITASNSGYTILFRHVYLAGSQEDSFDNSAEYAAVVENIPATAIHVWSYEGTPDRDVQVNTRITLSELLSSEGGEPQSNEGASLYLFYASDGNVSLAYEEKDSTNTESQFMEYQLNAQPS